VTPIVLPLYHWGTHSIDLVSLLFVESSFIRRILVVFCEGMIDLMPENRKFRYPRPCVPITVLFGEPMDFTSLVKESKHQKRDPKEVYKEITDRIYIEVKMLEDTAKRLVHAADESQVNQ
jgi:hypothetical protein